MKRKIVILFTLLWLTVCSNAAPVAYEYYDYEDHILTEAEVRAIQLSSGRAETAEKIAIAALATVAETSPLSSTPPPSMDVSLPPLRKNEEVFTLSYE